MIKRLSQTMVALALISAGSVTADETSLRTAYLTGAGGWSGVTFHSFSILGVLPSLRADHWAFVVHATGRESSNTWITVEPMSFFELSGRFTVHPYYGVVDYEDPSGYYGIECLAIVGENAYLRVEPLFGSGLSMTLRFGPEPGEDGRRLVATHPTGDVDKCEYSDEDNPLFVLYLGQGVVDFGYLEN